MRYLLDTGILLRLVNRSDTLHQAVRAAVRELRLRQHTFCIGFQNAAEFWNVCTRPASARGGLGLSAAETARRLRVIERGVTVLSDTPATYAEWRRLVEAHRALGVQVHDARIAALMTTHGVSHLLTLNPTDFSRFAGITAHTPSDVTAAPPPASQP